VEAKEEISSIEAKEEKPQNWIILNDWLRYDQFHKLGKGAYGTVYNGIYTDDQGVEHRCAVKQIDADPKKCKIKDEVKFEHDIRMNEGY